MRKKYNYFINGEMVPRKEFMDRLKIDCQKVVRRDWYGWCIYQSGDGVKRYNQNRANK